MLKAEVKLIKRSLVKLTGDVRCCRRELRRHARTSMVPLLALKTNGWLSNCVPTTRWMMLSTSFSRHFITIEVNATGRYWFSSEGWSYLGTGMTVDVFRRMGTEVLQNSKKMDT